MPPHPITILNPQWPTIRGWLIQSKNPWNRPQAAVAEYEQALRLNPDDKEARENLQKALSELKKQQEEQQKQQQKSQSNMSQREAEQKLKLLQEKEKELQQRLQNQNKQKGGNQSKDW